MVRFKSLKTREKNTYKEMREIMTAVKAKIQRKTAAMTLSSSSKLRINTLAMLRVALILTLFLKGWTWRVTVKFKMKNILVRKT